MKSTQHSIAAHRGRGALALLVLAVAVQAAWAEDDAALGLEIAEPAAPASPAAPAPKDAAAGKTSAPQAAGATPAEAAAPAAPAPSSGKASTRLTAEALVGSTAQRYGLGTVREHRLSLGLSHSQALNGDWRVSLADRLDVVDPDAGYAHGVVNSLREAYASWQPGQGAWSVDAGRLNLRQGSSYGFNPTDFFRSGAVRLVTSADPQVLREGRLGTVMVRGQWLGSGGALSLALAPKLASQAATASWSPSLGSTNDRTRVLVTGDVAALRPVNLQASWFGSDDGRSLIGLNASAPLGQSAIGLLELAAGRDRQASAVLDPTQAAHKHGLRASTGMTLSLPQQTSVTVEYQYDGFALGKSQWEQVRAAASVDALGGYLLALQDRQDNATQHAVFIHAMTRSLGFKSLDASVIWRKNLDDGSRLAWVEGRWHFSSSDLALQWQATMGGADTEYGVLPLRRSVGLQWTGYF